MLLEAVQLYRSESNSSKLHNERIDTVKWLLMLVNVETVILKFSGDIMTSPFLHDTDGGGMPEAMQVKEELFPTLTSTLPGEATIVAGAAYKPRSCYKAQ